MIRASDIFHDGLEHIRRNIKVLSLNGRIRKLRSERRELLYDIGETAWTECNDLVKDLDSGLAALHAERQELIQNREMQMNSLSNDMSSRREDHEEKETRSFEFADGLEDLISERNTLRARRARLEAEIKQFEREQENRQEESEAEGEKPHEPAVEPDAITEARTKLNAILTEEEQTQNAIDKIHGEISSYRMAQQRFIDDVSALEKKQKSIEKETRKKLEPLDAKIKGQHRKLGELLLDNRPDCEPLVKHFSAYDLVDTALDAAENSLKSEKKLLGLLDKKAVLFFYAFSAAGILVLLAILWIVLTIIF